MKNLLKWWHAFDQLLFPNAPLCGLCAQNPSLAVGVCDVCLRSLSIDWKESLVFGRPCFSLVAYQGYVRDLIHRMKFQSGYDTAGSFGFLLGLAAREEPRLQHIDFLLPVPLHDNRLSKRGFNQASILADNINRAWKKPICSHMLRVRDTKPQSELSLGERKDNLLGAFDMLPGFDFKGKTCLIVDDVITSGHTFMVLANLVEQYGGIPMGLFVARTEARKE